MSLVPSRLVPLRLPPVCVAIMGSEPSEILEKADALARDNSFLELRLDYLPKPMLALPKIKRLFEYHHNMTLIATCRRAENGGKFRGSVASQFEILQKAATAGCQVVDLEWESASHCKAQQLLELRRQAALLVSHHDFRSTKKLDAILERMTSVPADFYKIVSTATNLYDNVQMLKLLRDHSDQYALVGLCMGEQGSLSRVLGVRAGSAFTFGAFSDCEKTAPGQITAQELRNLYRIDHIDVATRVYGVVGDPISHSLSPAIMNAALRRENVNGVYLALHAKELPDLLACVRDVPIHGLSVTMPYKESIIQYLDNTDPHTAKIGSCNTIVRAQDGKLYGFNTDTAGIVRPLEERTAIEGAKILVLGAGGAARAAVFGLKERGAEVFIVNRDPERAQKLARQAKARTAKRADLKKLSFDVIVNATPVGMGNSKDSPLNEGEVRARYVFDMVYDPVETQFLKIAKAAGAHIIPGFEMFVHQAAQQFEIWTGKPAPREEMLRVVTMALHERAAKKAAK